MDKNYELICYNGDCSKIKGEASNVFFPETVAEIKKLVLDFKDIVPRGMGSNVVGGCVPYNSVVIDMKKMNRIDFDIKSKSVYVGAGVSIKELNEKLKSIDYEFPIFGEGSIGGMIAMNVCSLMGVYGNIKDWISEIEFVNGNAEFIKSIKSDLNEICGLEGITGIIVGAKLKIIPYIKRSASIFQSSSLEEIFLTAKKLRVINSVAMLRFYSPYLSKLLGFPEKYHIIVVFNHDKGKIKGEEYKKLFERIRKDYYIFYKNGYRESEDPKFLFEKIREFVFFLNRLNIHYTGDFIQGIIYPYFDDDLKKFEVIKMIKRMNGVPGKYGIGIKRKDRIDDLQKKIVKRIKLRYDPFLKFNKDKYIDYYEMEIYKESIERKREENPDKMMDEFIEEMEKEEVLKMDKFDSRENIELDKEIIDKILFNKDPKEIKEDKDG
ncbi:MAG: FAD-binding oxidoreductase [Nanoarchaeota archaeon]